jgi:hypothetical protein
MLLLLLLQCSDWGAQQLSEQQLQYAALDAWLGLQLAEKLHQLWLQQQTPSVAAAAAAAGGVAASSGTDTRSLSSSSSSSSNNSSSSSGSNEANGGEGAIDNFSAAAAAVTSADLARFLAPFIIKYSRSSSSSRHVTRMPFLPDRSNKQRQLEPQCLQFVRLLPWLAPMIQRQACDTGGDHIHDNHHVQQQQRQQRQQDHSSQQHARILLQAAQQQLHLQHYAKAHPQLQSLLQQQRQQQLQQQRSSRRKHRQQQLQQQPADAAAAALLQQRRQRQLEQLQRLGQAAVAAALPARNVFAKMQQLKPARLPTRKSLQYENCRILAPDGRALATCGIKKASSSSNFVCISSASTSNTVYVEHCR